MPDVYGIWRPTPRRAPNDSSNVSGGKKNLTLGSPWRFLRALSRVELVALAGVAVALLTVGVARPAVVAARKRAATARLTLTTADASGKACCGQIWNTVPKDSYWILGVFRDGKSLNPADQDVSIPFTGSVTLDLYGSDSGRFEIGQRFRVDATLAGGGTVSAVAPPITSLGGSGGGGAGGGATARAASARAAATRRRPYAARGG